MNCNIFKKILNHSRDENFHNEFTMVKLLYNYWPLIINYHLKLSSNSFK